MCLTNFFNRSAIFITKHFSPRSIATFFLFILGMNLIFPREGYTPMLAIRIADEFHISLAAMGLFILVGAFVAYSHLDPLWTRLLGQVPYWLFLFGCYFVTWKMNLAWQGVIIYTGYGLILTYVLASDYVRELDEISNQHRL